MPRLFRFAGILCAFHPLVFAWADSWSAPPKVRDYVSRSGEYVFRVERPDGYQPGQCKGTLLRANGDKQEVIWSRPLINDHPPLQVYVSDSGRYVVTLDEWSRVGQLPVVIYAPLGSLGYVHNRESLQLEKDILYIKQTVSSFWWSEHSLVFFSPDSEVLFIRLHWGRLLLFRLHIGDVMDDEWYKMGKGWLIKEDEWKNLHEFARERIEQLALERLKSPEAKDRQTGAIVAGQITLKSALPRLRELLKDEEYYHQYTGLIRERHRYFVREAAQKAIDQIEGRASTQPSAFGN